MIYGPLDGEMVHFTYDCRNRLTEVTSDSGKTIRYTYDAENNRIAVTKNVGTNAETRTEYIVDSASGDLTQILQSKEIKDKNHYLLLRRKQTDSAGR